MEGTYESEIDPSVSEQSLGPSRLVWAHSWCFLDSYIDTLNSPNRRYNLPLAVHPPPTTYPNPLPSIHPLIHDTCDIIVAAKMVSQNPAVLAS